MPFVRNAEAVGSEDDSVSETQKLTNLLKQVLIDFAKDADRLGCMVPDFMIWNVRENKISKNVFVRLYTDSIKFTFIHGFRNCIRRRLKSTSVFWR